VSVSAITGGSGGGVEASLLHIQRLLEQQTRTIAAQSEKIGVLAREVDILKSKVGGAETEGAGAGGRKVVASTRQDQQDQSERIRELELELEVARS